MLPTNKLFVLLLAIIVTEGGVSVHNPFYCYSEDPIKPQLGMFNLHTAYENKRGQSINPNVSTCSPSKIWMTFRYGTRYPRDFEMRPMLEYSERIQNEIVSNYNKGRTTLCAPDFELIRNWRLSPNFTMELAELFTSTGWNELKGLAQRYKTAFPSLFPSTYSANDYYFRSMNNNRTTGSLLGFLDGLFGDSGDQVHIDYGSEPDLVLSPGSYCPLYLDVIGSEVEHHNFKEMPEYTQMTLDVSAKLGFHGSHALRIEEIETLTFICQYEQIIYADTLSPFCAAFSVSNHQVYEYYTDLLYTFHIGYGHSNIRTLIENVYCAIVQDMLRFLQSNDATDHKVRVFSAVPGGLGFFVTLGVFENDEPLTRHNFAQQTNRIFNTSDILPKAANLAVVRYDCADGDNDVLFLWNEKPLQIPGCQPNGLCKLSYLLERYSRFLNASCEEIFCNNF